MSTYVDMVDANASVANWLHPTLSLKGWVNRLVPRDDGCYTIVDSNRRQCHINDPSSHQVTGDPFHKVGDDVPT